MRKRRKSKLKKLTKINPSFENKNVFLQLQKISNLWGQNFVTKLCAKLQMPNLKRSSSTSHQYNYLIKRVLFAQSFATGLPKRSNNWRNLSMPVCMRNKYSFPSSAHVSCWEIRINLGATKIHELFNSSESPFVGRANAKQRRSRLNGAGIFVLGAKIWKII